MSEFSLKGVDFPEGYVALIDKPYEWTSADVVRKIKFQLRKCGYPKIKIGHAGTLDPLATGILLVCIGRATKQVEALQAERKEYIERAIAEPKKEYDAKPTPESEALLKKAKKQAQKEALQTIVLIPATEAEIREECKRRVKTYRSLLEELNDIVATRRDKTIGYDGSGNEARGEAYKTLLMNLALTEHQRWVASHELRGFSLAERTDIQHKLHRCICAWEELDCECTKSYDCNVVDTSIRLFLQSEFLKGGK